MELALLLTGEVELLEVLDESTEDRVLEVLLELLLELEELELFSVVWQAKSMKVDEIIQSHLTEKMLSKVVEKSLIMLRSRWLLKRDKYREILN